MTNEIKAPLHMLINCLDFLTCKVSVKFIAHFSIELSAFFVPIFKSSYIWSGYKSFVSYVYYKYFVYI